MKHKVKITKTSETTIVLDKNNKEEIAKWIDFAIKNNAIKFDEKKYSFSFELL